VALLPTSSSQKPSSYTTMASRRVAPGSTASLKRRPRSAEKPTVRMAAAMDAAPRR
jgi:hypothetical protein